MRGKFIVVEGLDGVGKSTACESLVASLEAGGNKVLFASEYDHPSSEAIRATLNNPSFNCPTFAEAMLFFASRLTHSAAVIQPALDAGYTVIVDRYVHTTLAYQGDDQKVWDLYALCKTQLPEPDMVLLIDMDYDLVLERIRNRGSALDRIELRDTAYFLRVQDRFRTFAATERNFKVINADQTCEVVVADCLTTLRGIGICDSL